VAEGERSMKALQGLGWAVVLSFTVLVLLVLGLMTGALPIEIPTRIVGAPVCEALNTNGRQFTAKTHGVSFTAITESNSGRGVVYRRVANTNSDYDVMGRFLPGNCQVGFVGFCIGEALPDLTDLSKDAPLDQQWFILPDNRGYIHGGVVQELAPGTIGKEPGHCEGGRDEPKQIALADPLPAPLVSGTMIKIMADDAATVAAAVYSVDANGKSDWRRAGVDVKASDGFGLSLDLAASVPQSGATLLLTVCWAGAVPGRAESQMTVDIGAPSDLKPDSATPDTRQGASVACKRVIGGA